MTLNGNGAVLDEFVTKLKGVAGANLDSVVLYGSAAAGDYQQDFSDFNVLCLLHTLDAPALNALRPAIAWWHEKGQPNPMIFTLGELQRSADVFAIELLDIKARHKVLTGTDHFTALNVPMDLHRVEVERELRTNVIRLRSAFLAAGADPKKQMALMSESLSSFATLFRHSLIALGQPAPENKREVFSAIGAHLGFSAAPFIAVLDARADTRKASSLDVAETFREFLHGAMKVADEVDRRLA
ncbi:MAG TPA: hypothetical protein VM009_05655 [Terriglobales bacterium]|nr:hypothetical protein [Terriglobales bacterium]